MNKGAAFEEYVKHVYSSLLNMKDEGILVSRKTIIRGKSGADHEIDVFYQFIRAGITHRVGIECKNLVRPVEKGDITEFEGKIRDIGGISGIVVSNSGYQDGAIKYAKHWDILLLETDDLPTISNLLASRLKSVALPDETYLGEPFWTIMEVEDGKVTGSYFAPPYGDGSNMIPLTFSKKHALQIFAEAKLDPAKWAVRGLPRYALRAFILLLELFEAKGNGAVICFKGPGVSPDEPFVGFKISRSELATDYYGESIPLVNQQTRT